MSHITLTPEEQREDLGLCLEVIENELKRRPGAMVPLTRLRTLARIGLAIQQQADIDRAQRRLNELAVHEMRRRYQHAISDSEGRCLRAERDRDNLSCDLDDARQRLTRQAASIAQLQERLQKTAAALGEVTAERDELAKNIEEWEFAPSTPFTNALNDLAQFAEENAESGPPDAQPEEFQTPLESLRWIAYHAALCYAVALERDQQGDMDEGEDEGQTEAPRLFRPSLPM